MWDRGEGQLEIYRSDVRQNPLCLGQSRGILRSKFGLRKLGSVTTSQWAILPYSLSVEMEKGVMMASRDHACLRHQQWVKRTNSNPLYFLLSPTLPTSASCNVCRYILQALLLGWWRPRRIVSSCEGWLGYYRFEMGNHKQSTSWSSQNLRYYP